MTRLRLRFLVIMPQEALIIGANSKDGTVQMYYDWMDVIPYAKTTTGSFEMPFR